MFLKTGYETFCTLLLFEPFQDVVVKRETTHSLEQKVMCSRCGVPGVALNTSKAYADPRSGAGEGDEAMTIKQYESI